MWITGMKTDSGNLLRSLVGKKGLILGALVIVQGDGSTLKLEITQAVSALTGLGTDRITVIRGG